MLQNQAEKASKIQEYLTKGDAKTAQAIEEEFFWSIDTAVPDLKELGFQVETTRFSDLSWGVVARKWKAQNEPALMSSSFLDPS